MEYEVKEFYDAETFYEYRKICSTLFRVPIKELCDYDEYLKVFNGYEKDPDFLRLGSFAEGKLHGGVQFPHFMVNYDGNVLKMYGPGGVVSNFNQPFKGAIKQIFKRAFEIMKERKAYISYVFPFSDNYYRQFGYETTGLKTLWEIPVCGFKSYDDGYFVSFDNSDKMKEEIKDIYNSFSSKRNMSVVRNDKDWDKFFASHTQYKDNMYSFVSYTDTGADGFMCFSLKDTPDDLPNVIVESLWFKSYKGLRALLSYFATQTIYIKNVYINLAADVDLYPVIDSRLVNALRRTNCKISTNGQTRIVCAEEILKLSKYQGEGKVTIKIKDDTYCPWNNNCYTITFGKSTTVTIGGEPDIEMNINAFSAGIMGYTDFDALTIFPDVKMYGNEENLRKVFYKKPSWIEEHY